MSSHTDRVDKHVDEPFQQFRQYGASLKDRKGAKTGKLMFKKLFLH